VKKQKLTPWFPIQLNPARDGVYQVMTAEGFDMPWLSEYRDGEWMGTVAGQCKPSYAVTFGRKYGHTHCALTHWRGLAKEPK
jgi:hypothetical protein